MFTCWRQGPVSHSGRKNSVASSRMLRTPRSRKMSDAVEKENSCSFRRFLSVGVKHFNHSTPNQFKPWKWHPSDFCCLFLHQVPIFINSLLLLLQTTTSKTTTGFCFSSTRNTTITDIFLLSLYISPSLFPFLYPSKKRHGKKNKFWRWT